MLLTEDITIELVGHPATPTVLQLTSPAVTSGIDGCQIGAHGLDGPCRLVSVTPMSATGDVLDVRPLAFTNQPCQAGQFSAGRCGVSATGGVEEVNRSTTIIHSEASSSPECVL